MEGRCVCSNFRRLDRTETHITRFYAYPVLSPIPETQPFPPIVLDESEGIFYVNAMETAFSTIETEMLSGKNVAQLVARSLLKK